MLPTEHDNACFLNIGGYAESYKNILVLSIENTSNQMKM